MVIDWEKFDCYNIEVSIIYIVIISLSHFAIIMANITIHITGVDEDANLEKVQFGRIINGELKYDSGESDSTVFAGFYINACIFVATSTHYLLCYISLDGIAEDEEYFRIKLPLFAIYTILSVIGVIFALVCFLFNIWFRNQKYVAIHMYTCSYHYACMQQILKYCYFTGW